MDFDLPLDLQAYLRELDAFIAEQITPLQARDDHQRFFDHRREWARTDFDNGGLPRPEWEALLKQVRRLADAAGHLRFALPREVGGRTAATCGWPSSASTWRPRAWGCTTTCRPNIRSSPTTPSC